MCKEVVSHIMCQFIGHRSPQMDNSHTKPCRKCRELYEHDENIRQDQREFDAQIAENHVEFIRGVEQQGSIRERTKRQIAESIRTSRRSA